MASIRKKTGKHGTSYEIRISFGLNPDGSQNVKSYSYRPKETAPTKQKKEVETYAVKLEEALRNGTYLNGEKITLAEYFETWKGSGAKDLTRAQQEQYMAIMENNYLPLLGGRKLSSISPYELQEIEANFEANELKPWTIKRFFTVLSSIFSDAVDHRVIDDNPVKHVRMPKTTTSPEKAKYFDLSEAMVFLSALDKTYSFQHSAHTYTRKDGGVRTIPEYQQNLRVPFQTKVFMTVALYTGARRGELIALTFKDIDWEKSLIRINKNAVTVKGDQILKEPKTRAGIRDITLPIECMDLLRQLRANHYDLAEKNGTRWRGKTGKQFDENFVFCQDNGLMLNLSTPTHAFKKIIKLYNGTVADSDQKLPDIHLHDLRHTSATLLISSGINIETIAKRLGHAKVSMTLDTYGHALNAFDAVASATLEALLSPKEETKGTMALTEKERELIMTLRSPKALDPQFINQLKNLIATLAPSTEG